MRSVFRKISILLAVILTLGCLEPAYVFADEVAVNKRSEYKEVSDVQVTHLELPTPGKSLAKTATVTSAEGETWEIAVVWFDDSGKTATIAEPGRKYYPTFAFYLPGGYKLKGGNATGSFKLKLSPALAAYFGSDSFTYVYDPATAITYMAYTPAFVPGTGTVPSSETESSKEKSKDSKDASDDDDDDDDKHIDIVEMYCTENAINAYDREYLEWLIDYIRYEVQPQAVKLFKEKFPKSFGSADRETELSKNLGLIIYYKSCEIDGTTSPGNALAFVDGDYKNEKFSMYMAYDAAEFTTLDKNGKAVMNEASEIDFQNTVIHEMLHAFMNDYTRYGMYRTMGSGGTIEKKEAFPNWFVEGFATAVQNGYQFRYSDYKRMYDEEQKKYTPASIRSGYLSKEGETDDWLNLEYCEETHNTASAYAAGSLAVIYLGYLAAMKNGNNPVQGENIDMDSIRGGLDDILLWLHGTKTGKDADASPLDNIVTFVSGDRYKHLVEGITDTQAYSLQFIKGDGEDGTYNVGETEVLGSMAFLEIYLNWLENYDLRDQDGNLKAEHANGSVLYNDQAYTTPIINGEKPLPTSYRIGEQEGPQSVESSVDDVRANYTAGQKWCGDGTHSYSVYDDQQDVAANAATDVSSLEEELENDPATESSDNTAETPEVTSEATPEITSEITPDATIEATPEVTPETTPEATPEVTPETTPEVTPETTPETIPEEIPEAIPEETPEVITEEASVPETSEDVSDETTENASEETSDDTTEEIPAD